MTHAQLITTTADPTSLFDLIGQSNNHTNGVWIQWVSGTVSYGSKSNQPFTLAAGGQQDGFFIPSVTDTKSIFFSGTSTFNIGLF